MHMMPNSSQKDNENMFYSEDKNPYMDDTAKKGLYKLN